MKRKIWIDGDSAYVPLTKGAVAVIDASDVPLVSAQKWCALQEPGGSIYAACSVKVAGKQKTIRMHRLIMGVGIGVEIDHADTDGLNNRRANLRVCTRSQNRANTRLSRRNTSGFKGVMRSGRLWRASIRKEGRFYSLGRYDTPERAHQAYAEAAQTLFGEYSRPI